MGGPRDPIALMMSGRLARLAAALVLGAVPVFAQTDAPANPSSGDPILIIVTFRLSFFSSPIHRSRKCTSSGVRSFPESVGRALPASGFFPVMPKQRSSTRASN